MPVTVQWRGVAVDPETALFLDAVAAEVTVMCKAAGVPDFTVMPIPGFGSYRSNAASAGTDSGGGHVDLNAEPLTDVQARILESAGRKKGGTSFFRPRTSPTGYVYGWQRHVHVLRSDCSDLAAPAIKQVGQYRRGLNGLADNGPDTGNRSWVNVTWGAVKDIASTIREVGGVTADAAQGGLTVADINSIDAKLDAILKEVSDDLDKEDGATIRRDLAWQNQQEAKLAGQIAGLSVAISALAAGKPVDLAAVTAAAKAGAQDALDEKIANANVNLNVAPSA